MKKLLVATMLLTASAAFAAKDAYDIRPGATAATAPTAVKWENANGAALAAATADDVLDGFVKDSESANALLAKLKGAYATDTLVARQVAAVSQRVMREDPCFLFFWKDFPSDGRKVWVGALLSTAETAKDDYVKMVCLDQLRWCGCPCPKVIGRVRGIGEASGSKAVRDFSEMVAAGLEGIGD